MFWLSRWTYSGVPGFGPAADAAAGRDSSAAAASVATLHPLDETIRRGDTPERPVSKPGRPSVAGYRRLVLGAGADALGGRAGRAECLVVAHRGEPDARHVAIDR